MFHKISCYISGKHLELNGKTFLLGKLSEEILNISNDEFRTLEEICRRVDVLSTHGNHFEMRIEMRELRAILMKREPFRTLENCPLEETLGNWVESLPNLMDEPYEDEEEAKPRYNPYSEYAVERRWDKYEQIVHDIFAFNNQVYGFLHNLKRLRKHSAESYAKAWFEYLCTSPALDRMRIAAHPDRIYLPRDPIVVQHIPRERPDRPGTYAIYACYETERLQSLLKLDFHRALAEGHSICECKNCGLFFLETKGYNTRYCDRPLVDNPERNCRNRGAKLKAREKTKDHPVLQSYMRAYKRVDSDWRRGNITIEDRDTLRLRLADLRDEAISGKHRDEEAEALMQSGPLYASLGIIRRGKSS